MIFCIHDVQGVHNAHVHVHDDFIVCGQDLYVVHFVHRFNNSNVHLQRGEQAEPVSQLPHRTDNLPPSSLAIVQVKHVTYNLLYILTKLKIFKKCSLMRF